jgi:hypothetical protein
MRKTIASYVQLAACVMFTLFAATSFGADKVDPTGTWKWSFTGQNGQARETTLKLKKDGDKISGTVSGRNGDTAIENAKLNGDEISFEVTREFNGNKMTSKYNGKISGDTIKGKSESKNRDGETRSRDWEAKREK